MAGPETPGIPGLQPPRDDCHFSFAPAETGDIETRAPEGLGARVFDAVLSAGMVKLVDTPDLGSGAARRGSSSLSTRTSIACVRPRGSRRAEAPEAAVGHLEVPVECSLKQTAVWAPPPR